MKYDFYEILCAGRFGGDKSIQEEEDLENSPKKNKRAKLGEPDTVL